MHSRLHKRLTFIYTFTTGFIITLLIFFAFLFVKYQTELNAKAAITNLFGEIEFKLQTEKQIEQTWLSINSSKYQVYIYIEDGRKPLQILDKVEFQAHKFDNPALVDKVKALAFAEGIDASLYPVSYMKENSSIFFLRDENNQPYYTSLSLIASSNGWQTIILIKSLSRQYNILMQYGLFFLLINIVLVFFLFFFSKHFVGKTLEPVIENERKQQEFVASASHELRSPLSVIRATVSSLKLRENYQDSLENESSALNSKLPAEGKNMGTRIDYYNDIDEEAIRMTKLIDELLLLTTSQAQQRVLNLEKLDTETFLIDLYDTYSLIAMNKELHLELDLPEEKSLPPMLVDKYRLGQALIILLDNAICYTPPKKSIIIHARYKKQLLYISIIDQGIGISEDKKPYIFDKFFRADPSRIDKSHFGLGLSIAMELIMLHNGTITVRDTPGGGTTFTIELTVDS
jgi:signal transduction histidine kinase